MKDLPSPWDLPSVICLTALLSPGISVVFAHLNFNWLQIVPHVAGHLHKIAVASVFLGDPAEHAQFGPVFVFRFPNFDWVSNGEQAYIASGAPGSAAGAALAVPG